MPCMEWGFPASGRHDPAIASSRPPPFPTRRRRPGAGDYRPRASACFRRPGIWMSDIDYTLLETTADDAFVRRLESVPREMSRMHGLPDRWLGEALLKLVRDVRERVPHLTHGMPEATLLYDAAPELARRLGCRITSIESTEASIRASDPTSLRKRVSDALRAMNTLRLAPARRDQDDQCPVAMLTHGVANGSPVAMALDRVAPPGPDASDACAVAVHRACVRRGHPERTAWDPSMQVIRIPSHPQHGPEPEDHASPSPR